ncbi:hypothetical protein CYMTET_48784 [Cymbomonas tetramitiformis]|uniref:Uncharacterized protein n=1 Tax=Cymbomonas tetramitiformis TaxID=36881 RepID=A0AAE0EVD0_9CHLO|nr:hypothetical protein CYMTET_48784 [Cymbomonas tetramitiformis]
MDNKASLGYWGKCWYYVVKPKLVFKTAKEIAIVDWRLAVIYYILVCGVICYLGYSMLRRAAFLSVEIPNMLLSSYISNGNVTAFQEETWEYMQTPLAKTAANYCARGSHYDFSWSGDWQYIFSGCTALSAGHFAQKGRHSNS